MNQYKLVNTLPRDTASVDAMGDADLLYVDMRTSLKIERDLNWLGYLLDQCAHAINRIAKACRKQDVYPSSLAESLNAIAIEL